MTFEEYQTAITRTLPALERRDTLAMLALGAADEAGEVAGAVKKYLYQGHDFDRGKLIEEIGDTLWYLTNLCTVIGAEVADVAAANVRKLERRFPDGFDAKRSRERRPTNGKHPAILPKVVYTTGNGPGAPLDDEHNIEPGVTTYGTTYGTDTL